MAGRNVGADLGSEKLPTSTLKEKETLSIGDKDDLVHININLRGTLRDEVANAQPVNEQDDNGGRWLAHMALLYKFVV